MKFTQRRNSQQFFTGLSILSVTFTYGCFAFGWRSCLQTINAITSPNKASAAAGSKPKSSFIAVPPQSVWSSGVNHVPTPAKNRITMITQETSVALSFPVTNWPISAIEIRNSAARPKIVATYLRFASLSFTTQAYHAFCGRATGK
jgi:hypothetical protein